MKVKQFSLGSNPSRNLSSTANILRFVACGFVVAGTACSKTNFKADENSTLGKPVVFENTYKVADSEVNYVQPNLGVNNTTLSFQVLDANGLLVQTLNKGDIRITENGRVVTDFTLNKNSQTFTKTVDILFAVDVTGSMTSTIESAKQKLVDFINNTRAQGYHTRMCLSTFGDYTVKKCARFYNNDPKVPATQTEVNELISEIAKLKALRGTSDPGGADLDENPMRAVIDAANAPWGADSQRFMILVTDAGFLYSPGNPGSVGSLAPKYSEVTAALTASNVKVFAVTPSLAGYNKPFGTVAGIAQFSQGEWYKYSDLVTGAITLNTVLNKIMSSVNTTFYADYSLTSNSVGFDATKPLSARDIQIELLNSTYQQQGYTVTSNLPNGRQPDPKKFTISDKPVDLSSLSVYVDGVLQKNNYSVIGGKEIEFAVARAANSNIKIAYRYSSLKDAISLLPITISIDAQRVDLLRFYVNGIEVDSKFFEVLPIDAYTSSIIFTDAVYAEDNLFGISRQGHLHVLIKGMSAE